jgi:hypothetical protein
MASIPFSPNADVVPTADVLVYQPQRCVFGAAREAIPALKKAKAMELTDQNLRDRSAMSPMDVLVDLHLAADIELPLDEVEALVRASRDVWHLACPSPNTEKMPDALKPMHVVAITSAGTHSARSAKRSRLPAQRAVDPGSG